MPLRSWFSLWFLFESCQVSLIFFSSVRCCINGTSSKTLVCVLGYGLFQAQVVTVFHVLFHTQ